MESIVIIVLAAGFLLAAVAIYRRGWAYPASTFGEVRLLVLILLFAAMVPLLWRIAGVVSDVNEAALLAECRRSHDPSSAACIATGTKPPNTIGRR